MQRIPTDTLSNWQNHSFKGYTDYQLTEDGGQQSIKARSIKSASALLHKVTINLDKTPYLNWRWRVNRVLNGTNERSRKGDDYAARVYVVKDGGWALWRTRSVNYVWSSNQPVGSVWPSSYTDQSMMVALRSSIADASQWRSEQRNVREDFKELFGDDVHQIDIIALMTDSDNTELSATAWYGEIYFSSE